MNTNYELPALEARREALLAELDQLEADSLANATPLRERAERLARIATGMLEVMRAELRALRLPA